MYFFSFYAQHLAGWVNHYKKLKVHFPTGNLPELAFIFSLSLSQLWSIISKIMESINVEMLNLLLMVSN